MGVVTDQPAERARPGAPKGRAAVSGVAAGAAAVGAAELAAGALDVTSVVVAVGEGVIETVPGGLAGAAIRLIGGLNRPGLVLGTLVVLPLPADAEFGLEGLSSFVTPSESFYRIDTALRIPRVLAEDWRLRIHGMVDEEVVLDYPGLLSHDVVEADVTLVCVSNEVGGDLVGNARWLGARLDEVLAGVGVSPEATQLVARSIDGYTGGFPVADALDGRDALLAVGMNGEPLPARHGYPVRLVVPGLYGYVSAVKWLSELEFTTFEAFDQYWVRRGWAERAPVKTQSRIDRPRRGARLDAGDVVVAGVAGEDTWRQWRHTVRLAPGERRIRVRATDGDGATQPGEPRRPVPDGAEGWHSVRVRAE